ncbi:hypothetical protein V3C99_005643, partial [Haemonchus contortus]
QETRSAMARYFSFPLLL